MSALVGILNVEGQPVDPPLITRMMDALAHRGPDGAGRWINGAVGLGHRLLHTTPESLHETQPFLSDDGQLVIVADGRIDNRPELKTALMSQGVNLRTDTDVELILRAYECWETSCAHHLLGDFAFALWDARRRRLFCARDPLGVKPLYYRWDQRRFLFASEIKALFAVRGVPKKTNDPLIADYLLSDFHDPDATFFEGIKQVRPAHLLCLQEGRVVITRYWDVDPSRQLMGERLEEYGEQFRHLFREAVQCRLRSCAPVGIALSGGIDSTAITAMAETLRRHDDTLPPVAAFTVLCEGLLEEEQEAIHNLVEAYGTELFSIHPEAINGGLLPDELFLACAETPHYQAVMIPPPMLERMAAQGCRVMLMGFGADELVHSGEFGVLEDLLRSFRFGRLTQEIRRMAWAYADEPRTLIRHLLRTQLRTQLPQHARRLMKTATGRQVPWWLDAAFAKRLKLNQRLKPALQRRFPTSCQERSYRVLTASAFALALNQIDGVVSAFRLECRHPFLDRRLIEWFLSIPSTVRLQAGYRKRLVQLALEGIVPGPLRARLGAEVAVPERDQRVQCQQATERFQRELFHPEAALFRYVDRAAAKRLQRQALQGQARPQALLWRFVQLERWLQRFFPVLNAPMDESKSEGASR